jgi:hypothetical protein
MIIIIIRGSIASCWRIDFGVRADGYAVRTATASRTVGQGWYWKLGAARQLAME